MVDVKSGIVVSGPEVTVTPGAAATRLGIATQDLADQVSPSISGLALGEIARGARGWPVRITLPGPAGLDARSALAAQPLPVPGGGGVTLADLATVRVNPGETEIARDNLRSMVAVSARLSGRDLGSAVAEIRRSMARELVLPAQVSVRFGGLWAEQQSSFLGLVGVLIGAAALVTLILLVSFQSWPQVACLMTVVFASLAGVLAALHATGSTFNISSFVGAIMVVGIVAENAYFLVVEHRTRLREGLAPAAAAAAAGRRRARPVLMTTIAGVAALSPLAVGLGAGSELLRPLAIAVIGGFTLSAALLLLVLPSLLARFGGREA